MSFYPYLQTLNIFEFTTIFSIFLILKTVIICGGLVLLYKIMAPKKIINTLPPRAGETKVEFLSTLRSMMIEILFISTVFFSGIIKHNQASHLSNTLTFIVCFLIFEIWFYATHRLLHLPSLYKFHRQHHSSTVITPWSASNFSVTEKTILLIGAYLIPFILTNFIPLSFEGIIFYNTYNFFSNAVGHSNLELGWKLLISKPLRYFIATSTYHNLHHRYPNKNFGLFMPLWDHLLKTNSPKYEEVFLDTINK